MPSTVFGPIFSPGVQDDEDVKRMLQGSSMVKVIIETLPKKKMMSMQIIQRGQKSQSAGSCVVSSGAVASLAEAPNAEAVGGRRYNLVSVSENLKSRQRATVV